MVSCYTTGSCTAGSNRGSPDADSVHQGAGCHCEFILPFDRKNQAETLKTEDLFRDASRRLFDQKAYFSRPYGIWAEMVYNADARTTAVARKMKEIFDPLNVMNPGKLCF